MQTRWAQEAPFNLGIIGGDNAYYAGCVAVAGAQVMKFWEYPTKGNDQKFAEITIGSGSTALTARATNTGDVIDWANMADYYDRSTSTDYSVAANKAVADLLYNVGRASDMSYSTSGSGTTARALGFYRIGADKQCRQYSAYLTAPEGVSFASFKFADDTLTGLTPTDAASPTSSHAIYDLSGRRLRSADGKGVVIIDGKKRMK